MDLETDDVLRVEVIGLLEELEKPVRWVNSGAGSITCIVPSGMNAVTNLSR